jgi:TIR domain
VEYDVFISHASEDKETVAKPLAAALEVVGAKVWLDVLTIGWGDSLSEAIDRGLARSRYGIVVLSPAFFKKDWTRQELGGLVQRQVGERRTVILPLYHDLTHSEVLAHSPTLADAVGLEWSMGPEALARRFKGMLTDESAPSAGTAEDAVKVSAQSMLERAKALLQREQQIPVDDLLRAETDAALTSLDTPAFDARRRVYGDEANFLDFKTRVHDYEAAMERVNAVQTAVAYYGGSEYHVALKRSLERFGDHQHGVGKASHASNEMQAYPAVLSFHRSAVAAIAAERWGNLRSLFQEAHVSQGALNGPRVPLILQMPPNKPFGYSGLDQWLAKDTWNQTNPNRYTPSEDHLAARCVESLAWLGIDEQEAERIFDIWLFLGQIAYLDVPNSRGRFDDYFSEGRWWRLFPSYGGWEHSPQGLLMARVLADGDASSILKSGIAGGSASTFLARGEGVRKMIEDRIRRR